MTTTVDAALDRSRELAASIQTHPSRHRVLTDRDSVGQMKANTLSLLADYLAAGIDPARSTVFTHSAVPALNQLMVTVPQPGDPS